MDRLDFVREDCVIIKRNECFYIDLKMYKSRQYGLVSLWIKAVHEKR
jgi:hypothetical protein